MFKFVAKQVVKKIAKAGADFADEINAEIKKQNELGTKQSGNLTKEVLADKHIRMCLRDLKNQLDAPHLKIGTRYDNVKGVIVSWDILAKNKSIKSFDFKNELESYIKRLVISNDTTDEKIDLLEDYLKSVHGEMSDEVLNNLIASRSIV